MGTESQGISIVVLSYERLDALAVLLRGLLAQDLGDLGLELLLCNNSAAVHLEPAPGTEIGELLRAFPDVKVFNSSHNWLCRIRYTIATLARYETIFFIDDDLSPTDAHLVRDLYDALHRLGPLDIVSGWTTLWTEWNEQTLTRVRMGFTRPEPTAITECDYFGPGLSMFAKRVILHPAIHDLPPGTLRYDSSWFPWLTTMELGSRKYYVPMHGRIHVHDQSRHAALSHAPGFHDERLAADKRAWKRGYRPVLIRLAGQSGAETSPELWAARTLYRVTLPW